MREKIFVTKSFLPPISKYMGYLRKIWSSQTLTNQGPLLQQFEESVESYTKVGNFQFVTNGTLALQLAVRTLGHGGEIITTPFTYVATLSSIIWENFTPVFVDIDKNTFNIDPDKIENKITANTKAILAVHVFGVPCDVKAIDKIAKKHNLKVIYDAAHAFGVKLNDKSVFSYGDIATCSFHATKVINTIEGGGVFCRTKKDYDTVDLMKRFGHTGDEHSMLGINAKASEFQAAMGLCNLQYIENITASRKKVYDWYNHFLDSYFERQHIPPGVTQNYAYYPLLLRSERQLELVLKKLGDEDIYPRRYFYPSLNTLNYLKNKQVCPISEDISRRIICLPLYMELRKKDVRRISSIILKTINEDNN